MGVEILDRKVVPSGRQNVSAMSATEAPLRMASSSRIPLRQGVPSDGMMDGLVNDFPTMSRSVIPRIRAPRIEEGGMVVEAEPMIRR